MILLSVDPGHTQSAVVMYDVSERHVSYKTIAENGILLERLPKLSGDVLLIEKVASFGMPVGEEVFETVFWSGRFAQVWGKRVERMTRQQIKMALCHKIVGVNDSVIRRRLIDIFGPSREAAIGRKKTPGPLYGVHDDEWAALALAVAWSTVNGLRSATA